MYDIGLNTAERSEVAGCAVSLRHKISIARMTKFSIFLKNLKSALRLCETASLPAARLRDSLKCDKYL